MKYDKYDLRNFVDVKTAHTQMIDTVNQFKTYRKARKISRQDLSKQSGVSYASIRRFEETGEIAFTSLLKLAQALKCLDDFDNLFQPRIIGRLEDQ